MKNLIILGGGESGVGAAILGKKQGFSVFLSDGGSIPQKYKDELEIYSIDFEENQHTIEKILSADLVIKSPGIPTTIPLIQQLKEKSIEIISEIEFASRYTTAKIIAITGSNGKTTTTSLLYHILKNAHLHVGLGGNIGKSFARQVALETFEYYVIEVSSFQLDDINSFAPHIAILTNITPDHLDRYEYNLNKYIASKFNITKFQKPTDYFIYFNDDENIKEYINNNSIQAQLIPYSLTTKNSIENQLINNNLILQTDQEEFSMNIEELALEGKHNVANSMAAGLAAKLLKVRKESLKASLQNFEAVEHRLEKVLSIHGIQFINDSKATNVNSVYYALDSMNTPTILIIGGVDKGNDYNEILELVKSKVKAIVCLGIDNKKLIETFTGVVPTILDTNSMEDAVKAAYSQGIKGDTVLLSPACASFDLFKNYEDRGKQFKENVRKL